MRAVRVDKTCLMVLERTLQLFRDPARLRARTSDLPHDQPRRRTHLQARAGELARLIAAAAPKVGTEIRREPGFSRQRFLADGGDSQLCRDGFPAGQ